MQSLFQTKVKNNKELDSKKKFNIESIYLIIALCTRLFFSYSALLEFFSFFFFFFFLSSISFPSFFTVSRVFMSV